MIPAKHLVTATVLRSGARDAFGDEGPGSEYDIPRCLIAPSLGSGKSASNEVGSFANTVVTGAVLYMPPGSALDPSDKVRVRGQLYEVDGEVGDWGVSGMQVSLRRSTG